MAACAHARPHNLERPRLFFPCGVCAQVAFPVMLDARLRPCAHASTCLVCRSPSPSCLTPLSSAAPSCRRSSRGRASRVSGGPGVCGRSVATWAWAAGGACPCHQHLVLPLPSKQFVLLPNASPRCSQGTGGPQSGPGQEAEAGGRRRRWRQRRRGRACGACSGSARRG